MQERLKSVGSDLLENSVGVGAEGLHARSCKGSPRAGRPDLADPRPAASDDPANNARNFARKRRRERDASMNQG